MAERSVRRADRPREFRAGRRGAPIVAVMTRSASPRIRPAGLPLLVAFVLLWLGAGPLAAGPALPDTLAAGGSFRVAEVVDGDTLVLEDGREVRLVGLQAPKLPLGREGFETWPLAEEARAALVELAQGRQVTLGYGGRRVDRHGRALAHLFRDDGLWLQGELLARGLGRVYSFSDNRALVTEMLERERRARREGAGIWSDPWYGIRAADQLSDAIDSFQLVEGRVLDAAVVRDRGYLNFGRDWKDDFTVSIDPEARRLFEAAGRPVESFEGLRIRVRGWIKSFNGPMIEATHPEQIEVIGP